MTLLELINNIAPLAIQFFTIWIIAKSIVAIVDIKWGSKK